ncbi:type I secretion system permease/ATPase [Spartinivicinus poritis]|uniref:Type I secretion system permease/ATPase n=1 Tax=Spartinivicinus poritis TaxID=2994640 RepID=A0ABT5UFY3_9GAMM|nr:type I secretion system permease/ATPase [Spartinivicinus sp. A2-2]MDE1464368.1 type I secretion system permease/ATPase [Spartinivicinus sp. A2-2]
MKYQPTAEDSQTTLTALQGMLTIAVLLQAVEDPKQHEALVNELSSLPIKQATKQFARQLQLRAKLTAAKAEKMTGLELPLLFLSTEGEYCLLLKLNDKQALIQRPSVGRPEVVEITALEQMWQGPIISVSSKIVADGAKRKFDISWFIPEFIRHRKLLKEVIIAAFFLQVVALVSPLFFQVVMDKVLVHQALSTLDVLVIVLVVVAIFEIVLKGLREYLFAHTTTRIDVQLGSQLFKHLLNLPLIYFKSRSVGVTVMRIRELDTIREFITGAGLTLLVDLTFTIVFFAVMYYYSFFLATLVLLSVPLYIGLSVLITNPLQSRIENLFQCGAINNAFLTETVSGVETVKSLSLEPQLQRRWESQTHDYVKANYQVQWLQVLTSQGVQMIQKVTMVLVLWFGARMVIDLELSIGQLIAFNMMANHVSQPVIRLAELWQQFVQARVSVDRLGDVLNTVPEQNKESARLLEKPKGRIDIDNVIFRYRPDLPPVINEMSLTIQPGELIGVVGPSGSGKSTLTKLIQRLYIPERGRLLLDGQDIRQLDPNSMRSHIGVVLQENYLFNRTVRDNIALSQPAATMDQVMRAAKLAGAHEFIIELPDGYDTVLAENGSSLSGGQRQRVAIARALLNDPAILIFDEATSALDDISQAVIQENMADICQGRTVIVIAHRLSTVKACDRIIAVDKGQIVEAGNHDQLMAANGCYAKLWSMQRV